MTANRAWLTASCLLAVACASSRQEQAQQKDSWEKAAPVKRAEAPPFDPGEFESRRLRPNECEEEARAYLSQSPNDAWRALRICAKNPQFTQLTKVVSEAWIDQLTTRDDAALLVARVVANRGGSLTRDMQILHEHRFPLFGFGAAMSQPDTYKGRLVLIRAKVSDIRRQGAATTVKLAEYSLGSSDYEATVGTKQRTTRSGEYEGSSSSRGSVKGEVKTTRYGNASGSASYESEHKSKGKSSSTKTDEEVETKWDNFASETGRQALGRLAKSDPFLVPDKEFIILARFDGTRSMDSGEEPMDVGVLSVLAYFEPSALVVY